MALTKANPEDIFTVTKNIEGAASFPYQTTDEAAARNLWEDLYRNLLDTETRAWSLSLTNNGLFLEEATYTPEAN